MISFPGTSILIFIYEIIFISYEKQIEQETEIKKLGNGSSFKAASHPSFYHRRSMSLKPDSPEVSGKLTIYAHC